MNIYLASKYSRMEELRSYRAELQALGHTVTSRWLDGNHEASDESDPTNADLVRWALEDIEDIHASDLLICFTGGEKSTGRNIEFGIMLASNALGAVMIVGPRESVFHHLPKVGHCDTWADALETLK